MKKAPATGRGRGGVALPAFGEQQYSSDTLADTDPKSIACYGVMVFT